MGLLQRPGPPKTFFTPGNAGWKNCGGTTTTTTTTIPLTCGLFRMTPSRTPVGILTTPPTTIHGDLRLRRNCRRRIRHATMAWPVQHRVRPVPKAVSRLTNCSCPGTITTNQSFNLPKVTTVASPPAVPNTRTCSNGPRKWSNVGGLLSLPEKEGCQRKVQPLHRSYHRRPSSRTQHQHPCDPIVPPRPPNNNRSHNNSPNAIELRPRSKKISTLTAVVAVCSMSSTGF